MEASKVYEAIKANDADTVKTLLSDAATDCALRDTDGRSFLHHAVLTAADPIVIQALVNGGVDIAVRDNQGNTVLDLVLSGSYPEATKQALETAVKQIILDAKENEAKRLLLSGWCQWVVTLEEAKQKSEKAAELLARLTKLQAKVSLVHKAVKDGSLEELKNLLDNKELASAADKTGLLPLQKAVLYRQETIVNYFITNFKEVLSKKDNMGRTALHFAASLPDEGKLYAALHAAGADDTIKDLVGKTPADYDKQPADLPIEKILKRVDEILTQSTIIKEPTKESEEVKSEDSSDKKKGSDTKPEKGAETKHMDTDKKSHHLAEKNKKHTTEPPKPAQVTPVTMFVSKRCGPREPPPTTVDGKYVAEHLGAALTIALAEIAEKRPWDPIEYLGQWLHKHRKNMNDDDKQHQLLNQIRAEEDETNKENINKFRREEEQRRLQEEERRKREEAEEERKRQEEEEDKQRQAKEAALAQKPQLPTVTEEEVEDTMFRERDEAGQTELHILAAQSGSDLVTLINLGYSLADRDQNNQTPRDIAEENELMENVEAIDNYVTNLLEQEKFETLNQLILDGYDKLDTVFEKVSTEGLPENATNFVKYIPQLQGMVEATFKAVQSGIARDVENALEKKSLVLAKDKYGRSPLHVAILANQAEIAHNIVKNFPVAVKARDNLNRTPLHYAAALSDELAELLKQNGADASAKDVRKHTPSYYKDEKEEILKLKETLSLATSENEATSTIVEEKSSSEQYTKYDTPKDDKEN